MANYIAKGRQVVLPLTNKSGAAAEYGDVVVLDTTTAESFATTTTTAYSAGFIGVVIDQIGIAINAVGRVCIVGYVAQVNLDGAAAIGDFLFTDTVAEQGTPAAVRAEGAFGQALTASATPAAYIWGDPDQAGGGGGAPTDADYWIETADGGLSAEVVVGTTGITTAAYASRQAAAKAGRIFLPSDGFVLERDTGAAWEGWGPINKMTKPVLTDFQWVNQGTATATDAGGGIYLYAAAAAGVSQKILKRAAPAAPYTIRICFIPQLMLYNATRCGFLWRNSADNKQVNVSFVYVNGWLMLGEDFSDYNTYVANNFGGIVYPVSYPIWWQLADNNTNRSVSWSADGKNFISLWSEGRTTYTTPDEVGIFVNAEQGNYPAAMTLLHWAVT